MARRGCGGLSDSQKAELFERWKNGESMSDIGRALQTLALNRTPDKPSKSASWVHNVPS